MTRLARFLGLLPAVTGLAVAALAGRAEEATPVKTVCVPQWSPQAQFAGYYVALDKRFYTRQGLDVMLLRGGPAQPPDRLLETGAADFGMLFLSSGIVRAADTNLPPLVHIAQIVQRSSLLLVARADSGIRSPADLQGRRVSLWPIFDVQPRALFRQFNVHPRIVPQGDTINLFLRGGVDAASAMWYNEYHLLLNAGLDPDELVVFRFDAFGLNFPEDGLYARAETARDVSRCRAFVTASLAGWRYAFEHPDEALDIVMRQVQDANRATNRVHQRWMLARMKELICPDGEQSNMGRLKRDDFDRVAGELQTGGLIKALPSWDRFQTDVLAAPNAERTP